MDDVSFVMEGTKRIRCLIEYVGSAVLPLLLQLLVETPGVPWLACRTGRVGRSASSESSVRMTTLPVTSVLVDSPAPAQRRAGIPCEEVLS